MVAVLSDTGWIELRRSEWEGVLEEVLLRRREQRLTVLHDPVTHFVVSKRLGLRNNAVTSPSPSGRPAASEGKAERCRRQAAAPSQRMRHVRWTSGPLGARNAGHARGPAGSPRA